VQLAIYSIREQQNFPIETSAGFIRILRLDSPLDVSLPSPIPKSCHRFLALSTARNFGNKFLMPILFFRAAFFLALSALRPQSLEQKRVITVFASNDLPQCSHTLYFQFAVSYMLNLY
jgi:hypothetical protein